MQGKRVKKQYLDCFGRYLKEQERSFSTVEKYVGEVSRFVCWLKGAEVTKEAVARWKGHLQRKGYAPSTINGKLTALDRFLDFLGWQDCKVKHLRLQRRFFRDDRRELNQKEYERLISTAKGRGKERLALIMESICGTGIRVSEVKYLTVEAAETGRAEISLKGKIRSILIPGKLCKKLLKYAKKHKIDSGEIFLTRKGRSLSRKQIWSEMKLLCERAGVMASKVFPHNLRHLFARAFYRVCRDVSKLADLLGHSSLETTRLYLISTGLAHSRALERLGLVS